MLVLLEGPDGAGKSTLSNGLSELMMRSDPGCEVMQLHFGVPSKHPLDEYLRSLSSYRPGSRKHIICDRFHWGERIYPIIRDRPTQLDDAAWWSIEAYLLRLGAVVVMVSQYHDQYPQVYERRGTGEESLTEIPLVEKLYREVQRTTLLPFVAFNWMSPVNGDMHRIVDKALGRDVITRGLNDFTTYSGPLSPHFLLFGDVRHNYDELAVFDPRFMDPAFVPFGATSGHFLLGALPRQLLPHVGVANACDVDDSMTLWRTLGAPRVVALGRNAHRRLEKTGVPHGTVPHPQYIRRFHHSRQREYGMLIDEQLRHGLDYSRWPKSSTASTDATSTPRSSTASGSRVSAARVGTA